MLRQKRLHIFRQGMLSPYMVRHDATEKPKRRESTKTLRTPDPERFTSTPAIPHPSFHCHMPDASFEVLEFSESTFVH